MNKRFVPNNGITVNESVNAGNSTNNDISSPSNTSWANVVVPHPVANPVKNNEKGKQKITQRGQNRILHGTAQSQNSDNGICCRY